MTSAAPIAYSSANERKWTGVDRTIDFLPEPHVPTLSENGYFSPVRLGFALAESMGSASITEECVLERGRTRLPRNYTDFGLTPVWTEYMEGDDITGFKQVVASPGVVFESTDYNASADMYSWPGEPMVEGHIGIGLTYQSRLVALCMGIASSEGPMITQLQDVSKIWDYKIGSRVPPFTNGLRSGIDWKRTLVPVWQKFVPSVLGAMGVCGTHDPVWMQSAINNHWLRDTVTDRMLRPLPETREQFIERIQGRLKQFENVYDATATALGGVVDPVTNNYVLPPNQSN